MMTHQEIVNWLREEDAARLEELWRLADQTRQAHVGDEVHLRGLVEISNHCARKCHYCGLRAPNRKLTRYRMDGQEILDCAAQAVQFGYGTVVLQAGEDEGISVNWLGGIIRSIKAQTPLAVTLSLGERSYADLAHWRLAGADRYLLRFETSNRRLFNKIHPPKKELSIADCGLPIEQPESGSCGTAAPGCAAPLLTQGASCHGAEHPRFAVLRQLRALGYEIGSGVMIGIPGQSYEDLAGDIEAFAALDLEMIGVGPFLPHPETPLGKATAEHAQSSIENRQSSIGQVPNTELMTYKVLALTRLACPDANIPSTTALATLNRANGRELGLKRGANIVMPNLTPVKYRAMYEIYPAKACIFESAADCQGCLTRRIESIGRRVGQGRGDSPRHAARASER